MLAGRSILDPGHRVAPAMADMTVPQRNPQSLAEAIPLTIVYETRISS